MNHNPFTQTGRLASGAFAPEDLYALLYCLALRSGLSEADALDVVQTVYLQYYIWKSKGGTINSSIAGYLTKILRNELTNRARSPRLNISDFPADMVAAPERELPQGPPAEKLFAITRSFLFGLNRLDRRIVILRFRGNSFRQIARHRRIEFSDKTVKRRFDEAIGRLGLLVKQAQ
ncbi:sigma-70 family RNA polymerase sigma factor [Bremerella cremea]|uniref:Sigma-70 family RNA polymerase sigma factor n=1 Tax=Bremerella cremea TaxID=1031537 RepID=A0A368KPK8_9BACT|nr:sigma-70 family RNA polymerase sigma factor [Bremerella cremea]RCS46472.1 sigma-70 family RNA polymerase sigma factor [Bremerella cremea]